jgi:hypothetical protein
MSQARASALACAFRSCSVGRVHLQLLRVARGRKRLLRVLGARPDVLLACLEEDGARRGFARTGEHIDPEDGLEHVFELWECAAGVLVALGAGLERRTQPLDPRFDGLFAPPQSERALLEPGGVESRRRCCYGADEDLSLGGR